MYLYFNNWYPVYAVASCFHMASAYKNGQKFPIVMLGTGSGDWIKIKWGNSDKNFKLSG
jgi:hypothetical protein